MRKWKLPNLRMLLFVQACFIVLLPVYFMAILMDAITPKLWLFAAYCVALVLQSRVEKRVKAETDELALQVLRTAESCCLHSAEVVITVTAILIAANQVEPLFPVWMENLHIVLTVALFLIYLERAILFAYWDKKGLPPC